MAFRVEMLWDRLQQPEATAPCGSDCEQGKEDRFVVWKGLRKPRRNTISRIRRTQNADRHPTGTLVVSAST